MSYTFFLSNLYSICRVNILDSIVTFAVTIWIQVSITKLVSCNRPSKNTICTLWFHGWGSDMPLLLEAVAYSLMSKISSLHCALFLSISWNTQNAYSPQNLKSAFRCPKLMFPATTLAKDSKTVNNIKTNLLPLATKDLVSKMSKYWTTNNIFMKN